MPQAGRASASHADKEAWLKMAGAWTRLAEEAEQRRW